MLSWQKAMHALLNDHAFMHKKIAFLEEVYYSRDKCSKRNAIELHEKEQTT